VRRFSSWEAVVVGDCNRSIAVVSRLLERYRLVLDIGMGSCIVVCGLDLIYILLLVLLPRRSSPLIRL